MKTISLSDISRYSDEQHIELKNGLTIKVQTKADTDQGAPWEECDGHGPISDWTARDKRPGERVLCSDGRMKRYYDFAEAVRMAKRDGWDAAPYKTGTKGERAVRAVEADFNHLRRWCADLWQYIDVIVTLENEDGDELEIDSLWGVESDGDHWRETAVEMANRLLSKHETEQTERAHWEARDTVTL